MERDIVLGEGKIFTVDFSLLLNIIVCLLSVLYPACTSQHTEQLFRFDNDAEGKVTTTKPGDIIEPFWSIKAG